MRFSLHISCSTLQKQKKNTTDLQNITLNATCLPTKPKPTKIILQCTRLTPAYDAIPLIYHERMKRAHKTGSSVETWIPSGFKPKPAIHHEYHALTFPTFRNNLFTNKHEIPHHQHLENITCRKRNISNIYTSVCETECSISLQYRFNTKCLRSLILFARQDNMNFAYIQ